MELVSNLLDQLPVVTLRDKPTAILAMAAAVQPLLDPTAFPAQRGVLSEGFEFADEAFDGSGWVAALEIVTAEVAVAIARRTGRCCNPERS